MEPCYCGAQDCSECGVGPVEYARMEREEELKHEREEKLEKLRAELKAKHGEEWEDYYDEDEIPVEEVDEYDGYEPEPEPEPDPEECDRAADRYYDHLFNSPY
jgi:hypothetical protein